MRGRASVLTGRLIPARPLTRSRSRPRACRRQARGRVGLSRTGRGVGRSDMLSRTADNLYWLSRYTERADFVARILDADPAARGPAVELRRRAQRMGGRRRRRPATSTSSGGSTTSSTRTRSAISSPSARNNPSSIRNCIETARENARSVRTALTTEMWEAINGAWLELKRFDETAMSPRGVRRASSTG